MIARILVVGLSLLALSGCVNLTDDQEQVIAQAESMCTAPIKRDELLSAFGIEERPSLRLDGSVRSRRMSFTETWEHPSGLTITAYDTEPAGELKIVGASINADYIDPERNLTDFIGATGIGPPRQSFEGFTISKGDRVLLRSDENQGEQAASPNRLTHSESSFHRD